MKSLEVKQRELAELFQRFHDLETKYQFILDLGKRQPHLAPADKTEEHRVFGCQSTTYLKVRAESGRLYFDFESDALISAGLGQLLSLVYNGESAEVVLSSPPTYLKKLNIQQSLTPGRAQGLASMYMQMCHEARQFLERPLKTP